jgi:uncharacterized membrane protein
MTTDKRRKRIVWAVTLGSPVILFILLLLFDWTIARTWSTSYTISWLTLQASRSNVAIPYLVGLACGVWLGFVPGLICGHVFLGMRKK